jgi:hypothetical protein
MVQWIALMAIKGRFESFRSSEVAMSNHGKESNGCASAIILVLGTILGLIVLALSVHGGK